MPGKKKGSGKKKAKTRKLVGLYTPEELVRKFHKAYEKNCTLTKTAAARSLHGLMVQCMENDNLLAKVILEPNLERAIEEPVVSLEPLILAIRQERYSHIRDLLIWQLILPHENVASLALLIEKNICPFRHIELMDCLIQAHSIKRLALTFNMCSSLSKVTLDYNEFGDDGCQGVCEGLLDNKMITSLSLNYCDLGVASGRMLGLTVSTTAVRELYIDGNDLLCEGAMALIRPALEAFERQEELRRLEEAEREKNPPAVTSGDEKSRLGSANSVKKKKKKKKGKKSKEPPGPPPVDQWLSKLHIADNGIDNLGTNGPYAPLACMRLYRQLITSSKVLEELDLEDNLIGDLGGREILEALQEREEAKMPSVKLRTTHRMNGATFEELVKLGSGLKKKKKGRGKKKKK